MNTAFRAEITPAYFFLPDMWVNGTWQLSRHDDIWGGYVVKKREGRRNSYQIQPHLPLHTPVGRERTIGEVLGVLMDGSTKRRSQRRA